MEPKPPDDERPGTRHLVYTYYHDDENPYPVGYAPIISLLSCWLLNACEHGRQDRLAERDAYTEDALMAALIPLHLSDVDLTTMRRLLAMADWTIDDEQQRRRRVASRLEGHHSVEGGG